MTDIISTLQDFRARVIQADKLRRLGDEEGAAALMPQRAELIQAVKAYRASLGQRTPSRAASAKAKTEAARVAEMDAKDLI